MEVWTVKPLATRARAQAGRRDEPVICQYCGRKVRRKMRGQRYCSRRCRQKAHYAEKVARGDFSSFPTRTIARPTSPPKNQCVFNELQWPKSRSSAHIVGPAAVLAIELFNRAWECVVSTEGVPVEIARLCPRALVEARP